jgi:hypothetical protein
VRALVPLHDLYGLESSHAGPTGLNGAWPSLPVGSSGGWRKGMRGRRAAAWSLNALVLKVRGG